jgi:hypothetical protein
MKDEKRGIRMAKLTRKPHNLWDIPYILPSHQEELYQTLNGVGSNVESDENG